MWRPGRTTGWCMKRVLFASASTKTRTNMNKMSTFTHVDEHAQQPKMVDVGQKPQSHRLATARAVIQMPQHVFDQLKESGTSSKGPVLTTAIVAGVQGAKQTPSLIPFCHSVNLTNCSVKTAFLSEGAELELLCTAEAMDHTGVEMEALTGVSVSALTVYDMIKSMSKDITIRSIELIEKRGGKSGHYLREEPEDR